MVAAKVRPLISFILLVHNTPSTVSPPSLRSFLPYLYRTLKINRNVFKTILYLNDSTVLLNPSRAPTGIRSTPSATLIFALEKI